MDVVLGRVAECLESGNAVVGGPAQDHRTGETFTLPFLLNVGAGVLLYAFDSSSLAGGFIELPPEVRTNLDHVQAFLAGGGRNDLTGSLNRLLLELRVDPARVDPRELELLGSIMKLIDKRFPDAERVHIAVLH